MAFRGRTFSIIDEEPTQATEPSQIFQGRTFNIGEEPTMPIVPPSYTVPTRPTPLLPPEELGPISWWEKAKQVPSVWKEAITEKVIEPLARFRKPLEPVVLGPAAEVIPPEIKQPEDVLVEEIDEMEKDLESFTQQITNLDKQMESFAKVNAIKDYNQLLPEYNKLMSNYETKTNLYIEKLKAYNEIYKEEEKEAYIERLGLPEAELRAPEGEIPAKPPSKDQVKEWEKAWEKHHLPPRLDWYDKWKEIGGRPQQLVPFLADADEAYRLVKLLSIAQDFQAGKELTHGDLLTLKKYTEQSNRKKTFGYQVFDVISMLPAFWGELFLTSGIYSAGKAVAVKAAKEGLESLLQKSGQELLEKRLTRIGLNIIGGVIGGTLQTPVAGATRILAGVLDKELQGTISGGGDDLWMNIVKSFGEQWVETVSEHSGGLFKELGAPIRNKVVKLGLLNAFQKVNPGKKANDLRKILTRMGWDGTIEEMLEERMADVGHGILYELGLGEQEFKLPSWEQLGVELVSFSVPGAAFKVAEKLLPTVTAEPSPFEAPEAPPAEAPREAPRPVSPIERLETNIEEYQRTGPTMEHDVQPRNRALEIIEEEVEKPEVIAFEKAKVDEAVKIGELKTDEEGLITFFRAGKPKKEGLISATYNREVAERFAPEEEGKEIISFKARPEDVKVFIGKEEAEVLVDKDVITVEKPEPTKPVVPEKEEIIGVKKAVPEVKPEIVSEKEVVKVTKAEIPKELEPLAKEAMKYKSAEEFKKDLIKFAPDETIKPEELEDFDETAKAFLRNKDVGWGIKFEEATEMLVEQAQKLVDKGMDKSKASDKVLTNFYEEAIKITKLPPKIAPEVPEGVVEPRKPEVEVKPPIELSDQILAKAKKEKAFNTFKNSLTAEEFQNFDNVSEMKEYFESVKEVKPPMEPTEAIPEAIPKELEPLAEEARKYKSAEEFVKKSKDVVFRGSRSEKVKGITEGLYLSPDKDYSAGFGEVSEYIIPKDKLLDTRKTIDLEFLRENLTKQEFDYVMESGNKKLPSYAVSDILDDLVKEEGYKGIIFHESFYRGKDLESYYLFSPRDAKIATDFYTQATKEVKPPVEPKLPKKPKALALPPIKKEGLILEVVSPGELLPPKLRTVAKRGDENFDNFLERATEQQPALVKKYKEADLKKLFNNTIKEEVRKAVEKIEGRVPIFKKAQLKTLYSTSPEFRKNPQLEVVRGPDDIYTGKPTKQLEFKGKTESFAINAKALGLDEEKLKIGDIVRLDPESLKIKREEIRVMKYIGKGKPSVYAAEKEFAPIPLKDSITNIQMPEMVKLVKELSGLTPFLKKYPKALGHFYASEGRIGLKPDIFEDPDKAAKVLAHEVGHLIDWLPDKTIKRGTLLGRLQVLTNFRGQIIGNPDLLEKRKKLSTRIGFRRSLAKKGEATARQRMQLQEWTQELQSVNEQLVFAKDLQAELKKLTQWWAPFDEKKSSPGYVAYRYSSPELYADFVSVLLNKPEVLPEMTPKFYDLFFENLDKKPEVKEKYFELVDFLTGSSAAEILDRREADLIAGMRTAKEMEINRMAEPLERSLKEKASRLMTKLNRTFIEKNIDFIKRQEKAIKAGKKIEPNKNPAILLEELDLVRNEIAEVFDKVSPLEDNFTKAELTDEDVSTFLFFKRILGDRKGFANPYGHNPKTAQAGLDRLKEKWGDEKYKTAEQFVKDFQKIYKEEFKAGFESGLYDKELFEKLYNSQDVYATFRVIDHLLEGFVSPQMIHQVGTLKGIANSYQSTIAKIVAMRVGRVRNDFRREGGKMLQEILPGDEWQKARIDLRTGYARPNIVNKQGKTLSLIKWRQNGKLKGMYVDPYIADSFNSTPMLDQQLVRETVGFVNNKLLRKAYIDYSVRFILRNPLRDLRKAYKALSVADLQETGPFRVGILEFLSSIKKAYPEARAFAKGVKTETVQQVLSKKILGVDMDYKMTKEDLDEATALEREMMKRRIRLQRIEKSRNPITMLGNFIVQVGQTSESLTKIMAYKLLNKELGARGFIKMNKETAGYIRNHIGTPNWRKGGRITPTTNTLFMFSNVMLQGYKSSAYLMRKPNTRGGYLWRMAGIAILPKVLMFLATFGYLGSQLEDWYDKMSSYRKENFLCLPLGEHANKVVTFMLPLDYEERLITAIMWVTFKGIHEGKVKGTDIISLVAGEIPSLTNTLLLPIKWVQFLQGKNPKDEWRGRDVLTEKEKEAGGLYALKPMLKWSWNQVFGGILKLKIRDRVSKETWLEKVARLPLLGAFVDITDYGIQEKAKEVLDELSRKRARENLEKDKVVFEYVRKYEKEKGELETLLKKLESAVYGGQEVSKAKLTNLRKQFAAETIKSYNNAYLTSLVYTNIKEDQIALIKMFREELPPKEINRIGKILIGARVISINTWNEAIIKKSD